MLKKNNNEVDAVKPPSMDGFEEALRQMMQMRSGKKEKKKVR